MSTAELSLRDGESLGEFAWRIGWRKDSGETFANFLARVGAASPAEPERQDGSARVERLDSGDEDEDEDATPNAGAAFAAMKARRENAWRQPRDAKTPKSWEKGPAYAAHANAIGNVPTGADGHYDPNAEPNAEKERKGMLKRKKDAWKTPRAPRRSGR